MNDDESTKDDKPESIKDDHSMDSGEMPPIRYSLENLELIRFDANGLVPAIVQDWISDEVLMMAWMDYEALRRTLVSGRTWFWSRSRQEYWCKGKTSGNRQIVQKAFYDCDADVLLFQVSQEGEGACHTGQRTCFFRSFSTEDAAN